MAYSFDQIFAADPANPSNVAQNASVTIFAPGDVTMTPLAITDPDGQPLANPLTVNANGFGSAFAHETLDRVAWAGGSFTGFFTSYEGMKQVALDAQAAAETAAATAGADAAAVATAAISGVTADANAAAAAAVSAESAAEAAAAAAANSASLVGAPADDAIAAAINGTGATKTALDTKILGLGGDTFARLDDGGQTFSSKIGMLSGSAVVALLGDSTGNDDTEWFRTMLNSMGTSNPKVGFDYRVWNDSTKTYPAPTTIQAGTQDGTYVNDTFTRTGALIGSLPDVGPAWYGDSGADAQYTLNGTALTFTGTVLASYYNYGSAKQTVSCSFTFAATQSNTSLRLYGQYKDASNYVAIFITFGATITWTITKKIAGSFGTVATGTANPFAAGGATFNASITVNGTAVNTTVNGVALNGTLSAGDAAAIVGSVPAGGIGFNVVGGSADNFKIDYIGTSAAMQVSAYNGSVPGTATTDAVANLANGILPVAPDLVFISFSHNHGAETGATFTGKLLTLIAAVRAQWPDAGIALSSQNPRIVPAANITDHAARNVATRALASRHKWGYVPAFERFKAQTNIYALVNNTDGVHPVTAGSVVWRDAALSYINGLKPVTV